MEQTLEYLFFPSQPPPHHASTRVSHPFSLNITLCFGLRAVLGTKGTDGVGLLVLAQTTCSPLISGRHKQNQSKFMMLQLDKVQKHASSWMQIARITQCRVRVHVTLDREGTVTAASAKMVALLSRRNQMKDTISCFLSAFLFTFHHNIC